MPKKNNKKSDIDITNVIKSTLLTLLLIGATYFTIWAYFNIYKPKERAFMKGTNYAYQIIEKEALQYYRDNGEIYKDKNETIDNLCMVLAKKYSQNGGSCNVGAVGLLRENFLFKKSKITIYGFERPPIDSGGTLAKDILIDINGEEGDNELGVDRIPVRVHSKGRLGGILTPVNCNYKDEANFDMPRSALCPNGSELDFYLTNIPFGYDIIQIGGKQGKSRVLTRNVPFARADCAAFGGDLINSDSLCEDKGYYWLSACYDEYICAIELAKDKL